MNTRSIRIVAILVPLAAGAAVAWAPVARAAAPTADELAQASRWAAAKFAGTVQEAPVQRGLIVRANNDAVHRNARGGRPMRMGATEYRSGLYCHAYSNVLVRLAAPATTFTALAGIDTNDQTSGGRGSVVFRVLAGGKELFHSPLMREGMTPAAVRADLGGATEFVLEITDGGDGISCDQSDWADAKITMADGTVTALGDLPILERAAMPITADPPFSFRYGGKESSALLGGWGPKREAVQLDAARTRHTLLWTDPATHLEVRCAAVEYHDFPTVEWTVYFRNGGDRDTPILSDIQALDIRLERGWAGEFVLHHQTGSPCTVADYQPFRTELGPKASLAFAPPGGRPTDSVLPYFNLAWGGGGLIVVVGWPGQWAARFARDDGIGLSVRAGQELTHLKLHPGEEIRTPLIVLQFHQGDRVRSQNVWRRWMMEYNLPRPGGKLPPVEMAACSSHQFGEMIGANEANQKLFIDGYLARGFKLDYWWMDAGWYVNKSGWPNTGTWEVDTKRFPGGLRAITDYSHAKGVKSIVWFEPERVTPGTWLYEKHPQWLLGRDGDQKLLNLGNDEARAWLTGHVDDLLTGQGIDLYRQDFNMDPLGYWRGNDAQDRQGMTENAYVRGYLAYWDELRRRHPDMLIDSCASGGRRNDLETLRRAVPLLRSDLIIDPLANQGHTYGIAFWMPYYGTGTGATDSYGLRSVLCPHFTACWDMRRKDLDLSGARTLMEQWRRFAPCYFGDYYPLTSYSLEQTVWMAWQFDRGDLGGGLVQAFRRPESVYESARLKLTGLNPAARYVVTNLDEGPPAGRSGKELMEQGLLVTIPQRPGAAVIVYQKK